MSTTAVQAVTPPRPHHQNNRPSRPLFYRTSGVFDLSGNMLEHGRFDTTSVRKLQASVAQGKVLLVTDLQDTWIFPFTSAAQRERAIDSVLNRAPFLITSQSVYYVAYSPADFGDKLVVGDFDITVVSREVARSIIASAIAD